MTFAFDPSLKKLPKECREWLSRSGLQDQVRQDMDDLRGYLNQPGQLSTKVGYQLKQLWHYYSIAACDAFFRTDTSETAQFLRWSIAFGALSYRLRGMLNIMYPDAENFPSPLWECNRAAAPCMLSQWVEAEACAYFLIQIVHKDMAWHPDPKHRRYRHGTNDAFLAHLFSQAFNIPTHFQSPQPLVAAYQGLLDNWRTTDEAVFRVAMQAAAQFHVSRSKYTTSRNKYEFDTAVDRLFPPELLAVQALRRCDGLPEFETGSLLIDAPWAIVRNLLPVEPNPLAAAVEARLKHDYPQFL